MGQSYIASALDIGNFPGTNVEKWDENSQMKPSAKESVIPKSTSLLLEWCIICVGIFMYIIQSPRHSQSWLSDVMGIVRSQGKFEK